MARFVIPLVAVVTVSMAQGQDLDSDRGRPSRYLLIPFQGNFEDLFKKRLQAAKDIEPLRKLLEQLRLDSKNKNFEVFFLDKLDLNNPAVSKLLQSVLRTHQPGAPFTRDELAGFQKNFEKILRAGSVMARFPKEPWDKPGLRAPRGGPDMAVKPPPGLLDRWMRDLARNAENSNLQDWLGQSPAFQKGLADLKTLVNLDKKPSSWGLDQLPEHLRFTDNLKLGMSDSFFDKLKNFSLPEAPKVRLPRINLPGWNLPSVPLPNLGAPGRINLGATLLWAAVILVGVVLTWHIAKNPAPRAQVRAAPAALGPWPVDPVRVATRGQLIQAFDYLAVLLLGTEVRSWNHRAVARKLAAATDLRPEVEELTLLYEQARYTDGADALSAHDQSAVRRSLRLLTGVARA
jgi:hypothetical protein